jgi:DNA-directed RNA polymerase subunit RPC12/RpoP
MAYTDRGRIEAILDVNTKLKSSEINKFLKYMSSGGSCSYCGHSVVSCEFFMFTGILGKILLGVSGDHSRLYVCINCGSIWSA